MLAIKSLLEQQPMLALFVVIAFGYLAGEINIKGFSLGVGAVLFVALGIGWFAPGSVPPPMVGTLGLALFLYSVGIQYGDQFVAGLTSAAGLKANLVSLSGVLLSGAVSLFFAHALNLSLGHALGLFAGAGTSTPTLQALLEAMGNDDAAVGYSVAYPLGVSGPILGLFAMFLALKPKNEAPGNAAFEVMEVAVRNPAFYGKALREVMRALPAQVQIAAVRTSHRNEPASPELVVAEDDVLLAVAPSKLALEQASESIGEAAPGRLLKDRRDLDYVRVFASRHAVVGRTVASLDLPGGKASSVLHIRRGDTDLRPLPDLVVEFGDRIGIMANRSNFPALRKYFGDSIKGTAEFSYISIGIGMAVGLLVGVIPIPLPGAGSVKLGLSGVLIVALLLGRLRRTWGVNWTIPLSANLVLRSLGLTLFLAQVGMSSGPKFAATVTQTGPMMLGLAAAVVAALVIPIVVLGFAVFRMRFDEVAGILAGACGNPAILAYANRLAPGDKTDLGYAMIFPGMTIVKILLAVVVAALS
jgi:putative transport protein